MNYAVIDLGSNTVRLSIYRRTDDSHESFDELLSQKEFVGLAGYVVDKRLTEEGIARACSVLRVFREIALRFVDGGQVHLFATASLRNVQNGAEALQAIRDGCGLVPEILSGQEEARLDFLGAAQAVADIDTEAGLLIDIGGASTELVYFDKGQPRSMISLPIGCLSLYSAYIRRALPTERERKRIKAVIRQCFDEFVDLPEQEVSLMIGVGGTVRAALQLSRDLFDLPPDSRDLESGHIRELLWRLRTDDKEIFRCVYRQIPERTLTICPGLLILREAIRRFPCDRLVVSSYGVREGYLLDRVMRGESIHGHDRDPLDGDPGETTIGERSAPDRQ